jgi:hypothetical protein
VSGSNFTSVVVAVRATTSSTGVCGPLLKVAP